jgi:hypothetical protein
MRNIALETCISRLSGKSGIQRGERGFVKILILKTASPSAGIIPSTRFYGI